MADGAHTDATGILCRYVATYTEELLMGYRWFDATNTTPGTACVWPAIPVVAIGSTVAYVWSGILVHW